MSNELYDWDFFIAHASADEAAAENLYDVLDPRSRVFLDSRRLVPGDNWDEVLTSAQRSSLITVVLVSSNTGRAYYEREEIAAALELARSDKDKHRVVPLYLYGAGIHDAGVPYGLRLKHSIQLSKKLGLREAAERLLLALKVMKENEPRKGTLSPDIDQLKQKLRTIVELQKEDLIAELVAMEIQRTLVKAWVDGTEQRSPLR